MTGYHVVEYGGVLLIPGMTPLVALCTDGVWEVAPFRFIGPDGSGEEDDA